MKNLTKLFENLNRARSAKVPLLIITLVAVIGFSMAACSDGGDNQVPQLSSAKAITAFAFASPAATGTINEAVKIINVTVPYGTSVIALTPSVTHTGKSYSPTGTQNFTNPVIYTVMAEDGSKQNYTVTVTVAPIVGTVPAITTTSLPDGIVGTAYSQTLTATGTTPITWSIKTGTLPNGLTLSNAGVISGTPTAAGTSTFTVNATNATGIGAKQFSIFIDSNGGSRETAIPLTENTWADGNILTSGDVQWFSFTATASTQCIHVKFGTLKDLFMQVYDSSGTAVERQTNLSNSDTYISRSVTSGQEYYIKVITDSSRYGSNGTYQIGFTTWLIPPGVTPIPLTLDTWADGYVPTHGVQWFSFTATASTQKIYIYNGTLLNLELNIYDSSGTRLEGASFYAYETAISGISRSVTSGQTYYISVTPSGTRYNGTYWIGFTTNNSPSMTTLPTNGITQLTLNTWADGNIPINGVQWFSFIATASTQYIHVVFGTLTGLYVQVYDSNGTAVGIETQSSGSRSLTSGQTYYIRVRPYSNSTLIQSYSGTYKIGFTTSTTAPTS